MGERMMGERKLVREEILQAAIKHICKDREEEYGTPYENLQCADELIEVYLRYNGDKDVKEEMLMMLVKIARLITGGYKRDTVEDIAGYAALYGDRMELLETSPEQHQFICGTPMIEMAMEREERKKNGGLTFDE
jgi:hypothetical protein